MNAPLPDLTSPEVQQPLRHSASCASLSFALLETLDKILPQPPSLSLSVGSGPGLTEALLLQHFPSRAAQTDVIVPANEQGNTDTDDDNNHHDSESFESGYSSKARKVPRALRSFYGVEVKNAKDVNRYLPSENVITVPGTWALPGEEITRRVDGLLFVYPRQPGLVQKYLDKCLALRVVVWIGPRCDLDEFVRPFEVWGVRDHSVGGMDGEVPEILDGIGSGPSRVEAGSVTGGSGGQVNKLVEDGEVVMVYRRKAE